MSEALQLFGKAILALIFLYAAIRLGTFAFLRSKHDFTRNTKGK